jgi:hypothetical protein
MTQYTFTFDQAEERRFNEVLSRLEDDEFTVIEPVKLVDEKDPRYSDKQTVIEMDPEACLTIRMGMKNVKIRRARTEEELAVEQENEDRHKVKITVHVPMGDPASDK